MLSGVSVAAQPDYELDDFTAVSEWETFTSNVEECLREWLSTGSSSPTAVVSQQQQLASTWDSWLVRSCDLGTVGGQRFELVRHWHESVYERASSTTAQSAADGGVFLDLLDTRSDFDAVPAPEAYRLFGFREFALLRLRQAGSTALSIQLSNLLLSSLASAATAASSSLPMLLEMPSVQSGSSTGRLGYTGVSVSRVAVVDLNASLFNAPSRPPAHLSTQATGHLCYWLAVMRNHLRCPLWPQPPLQLSVRYSYFIRLQFPQFDPLEGEENADVSSLNSEGTIDSEEDYEDGFLHSKGRRRSLSISGESIYLNFCRLPYGVYVPGEAALEIGLTWPCLDDSHFTDSPVVSNSSSSDLINSVASCRGCTLDPSTAIDWIAKLWLEKQQQPLRCLLTDFLSGFSKAAAQLTSTTTSSSTSITTEAASSNKPATAATNHWSMRLVRHLATATASAAAAALPPPNLLPELVRTLVDVWIFPAKQPDETSSPVVEGDVRDLKAAPTDSVVERIAVAACVLSANFGHSAAVQFWQIICGRFQSHWESGRQIPRLDHALPPDLKQSLLAQKLQLLAYCIGQRLRREQEVATANSSFQEKTNEKKAGDGRARMLDPKVKLVSGKDFIYVPETQEPEPMTEDELPQFSIDSDNPAGIGLQHSIPCLASDMSSFKAANPTAELIDFLRWYSPRDVQQGDSDDGSKPVLSSRMCIQDNIWRTTWEKADPVPARRQKRLFDETRAAHGVLRWFTALSNSPSDLTLHLLPVLLGAALRKLLRESKNVLPTQPQHVPTSRFVKEAVDAAVEAAARAANAIFAYALANKNDDDLEGTNSTSAASSALSAAFDAISTAEQRICLLAVLKSRLSGAVVSGDGSADLDEFMCSLVANCSANYNGTAFPAPGKCPTLRGVILSLISSEAPSPVNVHAVIRANCPRPAAFSRSLPHRMYVRFQPNNPTPSCNHLAAAFSRDIIFA